jgi:hypothetical protein
VKRILISAFIGLSSASTLAQQQPAPAPAGTGVIAGVVTVAGTSTPARGAQVRLSSTAPRIGRVATTDDEGHFVFDRLAAADYTLSATKPGFLDMVYGARKPGPNAAGATIHLVAAQKLETIAIALVKGGAIGGAIVDEFGDPVFEARVTALRFSYVNGARTLAQSRTALTDDRGQYRLSGLLPGEYLVSAVHPQNTATTAAAGASERTRALEIAAQARRSGDTARADEIERAVQDLAAAAAVAATKKGYVPTFFPGVAQPAAASAVTLGLGHELGGIDLRLQRAFATTLRGTATSAEGTPPEFNVQLIDPAMPVAYVGVWFRTVKDGRFTFDGVQPGTYILRANASLPPTPPDVAGTILTAAADVTVAADGSAPQPVLRLVRGVQVAGRLALESLRGVVDPAKLRVRLEPISTPSELEMPVWNEPVDAQGRFVAKGVVPGRFRIVVTGLPSGWSLASALFAGREVADHHLIVEPDKTYSGVLTFTDRTAEVGGSITTAR